MKYRFSLRRKSKDMGYHPRRDDSDVVDTRNKGTTEDVFSYHHESRRPINSLKSTQSFISTVSTKLGGSNETDEGGDPLLPESPSWVSRRPDRVDEFFHAQQQQQQQQNHRQQVSYGDIKVGGTAESQRSVAASPESSAGGALLFHDGMSLAELTDLKPLANGGFCIICSCIYRGQKAVVKVPRHNELNGAVEDVLDEIDIYRRLSRVGGHFNIARAFGAGVHEQDGRLLPFLVLECVEGGSLAQTLDRNRSAKGSYSDPVPRLPIAWELARALSFLHNDAVPEGFIIHRDLKPANIGLCGEGHVKVFDLGLSAVQEHRGNSNDKYEMSGEAGSKRFMAPEVCRGLPYNEKVDVYSFSIVLWELCALQKPFVGMSVEDHYREVTMRGVRPPVDPRWPTPLTNLLEACWHPDPDVRPSINEARDQLAEIITTC